MPMFPHIETSQLICFANQLTGFYMRATLAFNGLNESIEPWTQPAFTCPNSRIEVLPPEKHVKYVET